VSKATGFGIQTSGGISSNAGKTSVSPKGSTTLTFKNTGSESEQINKATIGQGTIIVGGVEQTENDLKGLNRDVSQSQVITKENYITGALDASVTIDNRLLLGFLEQEVKDENGNTVYKEDENGNRVAVTMSGYQSIANDFANVGTNTAKAILGLTGTIISTGKTIYDVASNSEIEIGETAAQWKANQKTFVNQNNYDRETINNLSEGKSAEAIQAASGNTTRMYYDENDSDKGFRQKGDTDVNANYINAAQGTATDTKQFVGAAAHEYSHNYTINEAIAENAGSLAKFMWGLGNALNLTSVNTSGNATTQSWYRQNQNSGLLNYNTAVASSISADDRLHLVKEVAEGLSTKIAGGNSENKTPDYFSKQLAIFSSDADNALPVAQVGVDLLSILPIIGTPFDVVSFKLSEYSGDEAGMVLSIIGLDPQYAGAAAGITKTAADIAKNTKTGAKLADALVKSGDGLTEAALRITNNETKLANNTADTVVRYSNDRVVTIGESAIFLNKQKLTYITTSGAELVSDPYRTTTLLGLYQKDTQHILAELNYPKSISTLGNQGGFNLLNTPNDLYKTPNQFWDAYNKPWLNSVVNRGDNIILVTPPSAENLYRGNVLSMFGREVKYLESLGYKYNSKTQQMIKQ
jgi:hypothetical protein